MSEITDLADKIADLWSDECEAEEAALLAGDPLMRSNQQKKARDLAAERKALQDRLARERPESVTETLILALLAADFFASFDAGRAPANKPLRHLHDAVITGLEFAAGTTREELGLEFMWNSAHDGPLDS